MNTSIDHHQFIVTTDRKSLFTQLKGLVATAKEVHSEELEFRRKELQELLEYEDKIYEEEFSNKVKSRIDKDIKERKETLHKIKEANEIAAIEYLESKRIQQYMNNCYEIREALRHKEQRDVKECQLEQIAEKERQLRRQKDLDIYWLKVQRKNMELHDKKLESENCIKSKLVEQTRFVLGVQVEEMEAKREEIRQEKEKDIKDLAKILEELRLEKFDREHFGRMSPKILQYRKELQDDIEKKRIERLTEQCELAKEHRTMIEECQRLDAEEIAANEARKRAAHKAALEYINYLKRMRQLEEDQQRMRDERIDDLHTIDMCTKGNIQREVKRKAEVAAATYVELKRQICEQYERRLREENERRECKIIENRFARPEKTRADILQQRRQMRKELDEQIAALNCLRKREEEQYKKDLERAIDNPEFCAQLAEQYIRDGTDYLEPHANWRIIACSTKKNLPKKSLPYPDCADLPPEGAGAAATKQPCGCAARVVHECGGVRPLPRLDGNKKYW